MEEHNDHCNRCYHPQPLDSLHQQEEGPVAPAYTGLYGGGSLPLGIGAGATEYGTLAPSTSTTYSVDSIPAREHLEATFGQHRNPGCPTFSQLPVPEHDHSNRYCHTQPPDCLHQQEEGPVALNYAGLYSGGSLPLGTGAGATGNCTPAPSTSTTYGGDSIPAREHLRATFDQHRDPGCSTSFQLRVDTDTKPEKKNVSKAGQSKLYRESRKQKEADLQRQLTQIHGEIESLGVEKKKRKENIEQTKQKLWQRGQKPKI